MAVLAAAPGVALAADYSGIVVDAKTGHTLYEYRADARAYPASLTKMMTLYLLFEAMDAGKVTKTTSIPVSAHAASMQPTKLGVKAGGSVTVQQAILALVTKSANDMAAAIAEYLGGSETHFAEMMTAKARDLGMAHTVFHNASGLPDSRQFTTARDMARLGIALREHFPQYYSYFSTRVFTYHGRRMGNHNRLLGRVKGMDGIKTGYTRASGFNLVSSVETAGRSIVAVVMGGNTSRSRNAQMVTLIHRYLHKASRGEDRMVVARRGLNPFAVAAIKLPRKGPLPTYRADALDPDEQRIVTAHNVSSQDGTGFDVAMIERKLRQLSGHDLPVPTPAPGAATPVDRLATAAVQPNEPTEPVAYAPEPSERPAVAAINRVKSGWQVQIGAVPSRASALKLLKKARGKAPDILDPVRNYTEAVEKGSTTLYRARFAGFASKSAARHACGELKKKNFACLAIYYN